MTSLISKRITLLVIQTLISDVTMLKLSNFMGMSHCSRCLDGADSEYARIVFCNM